MDTIKRKYHNDPEKKRDAAKKRYNNKKTIKQYKRGKYLEIRTSKIMYQKAKYHKNPEVQQAYQKIITKGPYNICTICHGGLYQRSVRLCKHEKYNILTPSFDKKLYICETCHKHLNKNEIPCQVVSNKMAGDPISNELKDFKKLEKVLISKRILFNRITIMHGKGDFAKIKGRICNAPIEIENVAIFYQGQQLQMD